MVQVKAEFWMWSGKDLRPDFELPAGQLAARDVCVQDGTAVRALFEALEHYPRVKSEVFSDRHFRPEINLALNSLAMGHDGLYDRILADGDQITVFPMDAGG